MAVGSFDITSLDKREVLRYLGYHGQQTAPDLDTRIDEGIAHALEIGSPRGVWRVFDVEKVGETNGLPQVRLSHCALILQGHDIVDHLKGAVAVGLMAVTAGMGIDQELRRLSLTDALGQVVFDAASTALVERAADAAEAQLVAEADARDLYVNWRFSPGYGDLPLACQPELLASLDATRQLGLTLTPSLLLVPTKSVTAIIGFFPEPQASRVKLCNHCQIREFCSIRASGRTCHGRNE